VHVLHIQARAFYGFQIAIENIHSGESALAADPHLAPSQACSPPDASMHNTQSVYRQGTPTHF
jgi:hypothetical protein